MLGRIRATAAAARETGALLSIDTEHVVVDAAVPFLVRKVVSLARKDAAAARRAADAVAPAARKGGADVNPFLPYERAMFVQDVPPSHVCLLNKFNVVDDHVLLVTKDFEHQGSLLSAADFAAVWHVLGAMDGLAFYNAGKTAGASQRHKHLQAVPTPLARGLDGMRTPFDAALDLEGSDDARAGRVYSSPHLPFLHGIVRLDGCAGASPADAARATMEKYTALLSFLSVEVGIAHSAAEAGAAGADSAGVDECRPFPYNLLLTRDWLLLVPRRRECFESDEFEGRISVNALGFSGSLFVRDDEQLRVVGDDPMRVLRHVTYPATGS
jgi:sulfate adenylyltransferase (ADP) / ATP adenylyltransferase